MAYTYSTSYITRVCKVAESVLVTGTLPGYPPLNPTLLPLSHKPFIPPTLPLSLCLSLKKVPHVVGTI